MAISTGSSGQGWQTIAPLPTAGAAAISRSLPVAHDVLYEAPSGLYHQCLADLAGSVRPFDGTGSFTIVRRLVPQVHQVSWSLFTTTAPGIFDTIFFFVRNNVIFGLGSGSFHFAHISGYGDPLEASGSRRGLLITSLSAQPNETVAESPHISIEPLNFESDDKFIGDIYVVPAGISIHPGMRIIDTDSSGQYTGSFLTARVTESILELANRFTSSDAPIKRFLGLKVLVSNELVTVNSASLSGSLVRNEDWGGGLFLPSSTDVAVFGPAMDFLVPSGSYTIQNNPLSVLSGSLNVTSGSIYIRGNSGRLVISGISSSAFLTKGHGRQHFAHLTRSVGSIVNISTGFPGLNEGTVMLVPSGSTSELLELHVRVSGSWFDLLESIDNIFDGGTY